MKIDQLNALLAVASAEKARLADGGGARHGLWLIWLRSRVVWYYFGGGVEIVFCSTSQPRRKMLRFAIVRPVAM